MVMARATIFKTVYTIFQFEMGDTIVVIWVRVSKPCSKIWTYDLEELCKVLTLLLVVEMEVFLYILHNVA